MTSDIILREAEELFETIRKYRRDLHSIPGTEFDIAETVEYVRRELENMGIEPKNCGKAGLTAIIGREGKVFMLRADMDALPITEASGLDFAATNGKMHACGHDMHTAMLLGAAKILKKHETELKGRVKLMFQPAEEIFEGAKDMIAAGVLDDPKPDAAAMIHVAAAMPMETGTIAISSPGVSLPAADYFEINIQGKGCHGSMPNTGVDPITAAAHIVINLQELTARELSVKDSAVLTIGQFHSGKASNVIPDTASMGGTLRTYDEGVRQFMKERITDIAGNTAKVFRAKAKVSFGSGCPTLYNNPELVKQTEAYLREYMGEKAFVLENSGGGGSEDFAYITREIPSVMLNLAAGRPEDGYSYPQHHPQVKFDENALTAGTAAFVCLAARWLEENKEK